jgi:regulator of cell morphogenesis and NO signaling
VSDIVEMDYNIIKVLSRLGICLGNGDSTIESLCKKSGVNINSLHILIAMYSHHFYTPSHTLIERADIRDIIKYLRNSHIHYLQHNIVSLERELLKLIEPCNESMRKIICKFFNDYKSEVERHFEYEEQTVFTYIDSLIYGANSKEYSINQFIENHNNIDEKLNDLRNILLKYLPSECDTIECNKVIYKIFSLEEELERHTNVENNILIPMVAIIEGNE